MLGAIYGDIVGSVYEFDNIKTKDFPMFSSRCGYTDDTVMTVAVADALIQYERSMGGEEFKRLLISSMQEYGRSFPFAGYGAMFLRWLRSDDPQPYNSYGNGSAMRVSAIGWYAESLDEAIELATLSAEVTHNHPEGIKGAVCVAGAIYLARTGATRQQLREFVSEYYDINFTLDEIRNTYSFNETCQDTVPQALEAFFEAESFEDTIRCAISLGGDSDTLAAIAGSVAEAYFGMSEKEKQQALSYLDPSVSTVTAIFSSMFMH